MLSPARSSCSTPSSVSLSAPRSIARYSREPGACGANSPASTPAGMVVREQPGDAGVEPGRDAIEYQDRRHLAPPLDLREHAAAHAGARLEVVEREAPALPLEAQARPETGHVEPGGERGRT